jgi:serine-type D-Ala-D-Ala carboxypeptidase/endopeptidase (penicillin-binding protein 4)
MHHGTPQRRRSRRGLIITLVVVVVVAAAGITGYLLWPKSSQTTGGTSTSTVSTTRAQVVDPPVVVPAAKVAPIAAKAGKVPKAAAVQAKLAPVVSAQALGVFKGQVLDGATGAALWQAGQDDLVQPASSMKLLMGAALLTTVDPNSRLTTKVVQGPAAGEIIFVGGGDVTLSAARSGVTSVYTGAPTVDQLAEQIKATGYQVTKIITDTSYWSGERFATGWQQSDIQGTPTDGSGYITNMDALMVDGDRTDPSNENSKRSGTPAQTAAQALARALGNANLPIETGGKATGEEKVLAQVQSQPVSILLGQALVNSDNVLAEALGRQVAIARHAPPSFEGAVAATQLALQDLGIDSSTAKLYDSSGLSTQDLVPSSLLAEVIALAVSGKVPTLSPLLDDLPIAGVSGTLADRFDQPNTRVAAGWLRAKTGTLTGVYSLVGYVLDVDGRALVFSFNSGQPGAGTRDAQDRVGATLRICGCS